MLHDAWIREAVRFADGQMLSRLPAEKELSKRYDFSPGFLKRMEELMKLERRPFYHLFNTAAKRVAVVLITLLVAASALCLSVEPVRTEIFQFFIKTFASYSQLTPRADGNTPIKETIEEEYVLAGLPEGYQVHLRESGGDFGELVYTDYINEDGEYIYFYQCAAGIDSLLNTEGVTLEDIMIGNRQGKYFEDNESLRHVCWTQDGYTFEVRSTDMSKQELVELAKTIQKKQ